MPQQSDVTKQGNTILVNSQSSSNPDQHIALLIDADNAQYSLLKEMFEEASKYGELTIRRAYGDFTKPNLANWRTAMLEYAIHPIQQWRYTKGKNATDGALIIEAMDILHSETVQGFCIVSSDSDFTRLCTRIRESGLFVMGIGAKKTPQAFIKACNVFSYVEDLKKTTKAKKAKANTTPKAPPKPKPTASQKKFLKLLRQAFNNTQQDSKGWIGLSTLGNTLQDIDPNFTFKTYGYKSLSSLIMSMPEYVAVKGVKKTGASHIYVRLKDG